MRDLSTLAKLLAEEDINVVHRKQDTAAFDVKNRELSLPIWKEMSKDVQDLMTVHEVGHALWTPLEMLEKAQKENIEFSFVNVLEDVRIEKSVQSKYLGSVKIFKRGYQELISNNFFGTNGLDVSKMNLIDRINLHYKHFVDVPFSDEEMVWVKKSNQTVTPDDVLELAKELYDYIANNPESQEQSQDGAESDLEDHRDMMMGQPMQSGQEENSDDSDENMDGSGKSEESDDESSDENSTETGNSSGDESSEENEETTNGSEKSDEKSDDTSETKETVAESMSKGGKSNGEIITAVTDATSKNSSKSMLDNNAKQRHYAFMPKINLKETIVDYKTIMSTYGKKYYKEMNEIGETYFKSTSEALDKFTKDNKKTVAYMVKEFEMKKAADQYARASTSKTGSLDMGRLHTYKYNDDLFKKVTTLPGATNHGLVLMLDWSGSMASNLQGTLNQLYNLIWFCKRTQIPFEVFAFSDQWSAGDSRFDKKTPSKITSFKSGDLIVKDCNLLQFFSSKMNSKDIYKMMHNLNMYANTWSREFYGRRYRAPYCLELGGTPLGQAVACAMEFIPMYKKQTGVQKINTVFLTDGYGCNLNMTHHINTNKQTGVDFNGYKSTYYQDTLIMKDNVTNSSVSSDDHNQDSTAMLLELLKKRVPEMNIVNFFVAGNGQSGKVSKHAIEDIIRDDFLKEGQRRISNLDYWSMREKVKEISKKINKENVGIFDNTKGFDTVYLLPGLDYDTDSETLDVETGASKAQLKRAFGKMSNKKITNRPLLNNFVKMVA